MIRAIVFDFGNVVGFFDHRLVTDRLAIHAAIPAEAIHTSLFGSPLEADYDAGRIGTADFLRQVRQICRLRCSDETVSAAWVDIFRPNDEVIALLPRLEPRYRLILGSNTNELHSEQFTGQFAEALRHFDALVLSFQVGARKPDAAFFEHCRRFAGCPAGECLFIDDLPVNVAGARACGWQGIVYTDTPGLLEQFTALGVRLDPEP